MAERNHDRQGLPGGSLCCQELQRCPAAMPNMLLAPVQLSSLQQLGFASLSCIIVALCIKMFAGFSQSDQTICAQIAHLRAALMRSCNATALAVLSA